MVLFDFFKAMIRLIRLEDQQRILVERATNSSPTHPVRKLIQSLEGRHITGGVSGGIDTDGYDFKIYQPT